MNNYGDLNIFNGLDSNFLLFNTQLSNNTNIVFSLMRSTLVLDGINITNHSCSTMYKGCIGNGLSSYMTINNLILDTINTTLEDAAGFYLEISSGIFSNVNFKNLQSVKKIGNCFDLITSSLFLNFGTFQNFEQNCLNAQNSTISINNSYFNNEQALKTSDQSTFSFGTIYCQSCFQFVLNNSQLLRNDFSYYGGGVALISNEKDYNFSAQFFNVSFVANNAFQYGGAVYLSNVHSSFNFCNFSQNKADKGAAIYFYSLSNFFIIFDSISE